ncbi:methylmalonyl Co-A mutase-associated GTPase MeaB [Desulfofundulus thermocisternus]|uniref:methylmalonyl Co-A mutase-associated GTPase MeaB n=1 Tax=Desulfofundulus thermocisternus TaxID=42471 RepID=UPI00217EFC73|nr:methylmalonyl Co-A mutase-associated GTPase MeaB [Desulfofundulus thermocisternus]MCS5695849.1 methylmalonyl Co-A mutase-associated GTPase MeaB [Desulfofundulus thermocisternus]
MKDLESLMERFRGGDPRALARVISYLENEEPVVEQIMEQIYPFTGKAYIIGITGSPGAGKSSLVDCLTSLLRQKGETVGIVAVDPTSPFTGGALLGDRIRMQNHATDRGVFIRSMGTRGSLGGLAHTTADVVKAMDAFGFSRVIVETVGVGQAELDIMHLADTVVVVLTPGAGDAIQTIKAGIMEIADVFVINKSDLPGSDKITAEVEMMLDMQGYQQKWRPPVIKTSTLSGQGIEELLEAIENHRNHLLQEKALGEKRWSRARNETLELAQHIWQRIITRELEHIRPILDAVARREKGPYQGAREITSYLLKKYK